MKLRLAFCGVKYVFCFVKFVNDCDLRLKTSRSKNDVYILESGQYSVIRTKIFGRVLYTYQKMYLPLSTFPVPSCYPSPTNEGPAVNATDR